MERKFTFIDLFAGIGGIRMPFEELGGTCVFTSEWDKSAQMVYLANFGEKPHGDITKIESSKIPDHNILLAGFPCQPFSIIGNGLGFADTRGTLFFEIKRIIQDKRPKAFLLENVKNIQVTLIGRQGIRNILSHQKTLIEEQLLWLHLQKWKGTVTLEINPFSVLIESRGKMKQPMRKIVEFVRTTIDEGKTWS